MQDDGSHNIAASHGGLQPGIAVRKGNVGKFIEHQSNRDGQGAAVIPVCLIVQLLKRLRIEHTYQEVQRGVVAVGDHTENRLFAAAQLVQLHIVPAGDPLYFWQGESRQAHSSLHQNRLCGFASGLLENLVLPYRDMLRLLFLQGLEKQIKRGLEVIVVLLGAAVLKPGAFEKRPGRPGPGNIPQRKAITSGRKRAGKALMERAARKMKLHSQKQLAQRAGHTAKAAGSATKKLAAVTVRAARALVSAIAGIVGGTGVFMLLAVVLLGGALSAFGSSPGTGIYTPVSAEVEAFDPIIRIYATQHGIPEYVDLIKAVMMQESGGNVELVGGDVMQCAEGMGLPVGTPVDPEKSIDFGTSIIASNLQLAGATGPGDIPHISLALQGYNFGNGYISWALARGGYSKENAREFSVWQAGIHGWSGYGDIDYVDHVLRYYPLAANPLGGASAIAEGRFAFPFPGHTWDTYPGHNGIDISFANCYGEPVYACAPGTVRYIQDGWTPANGVDGMWSFGNCVVVDHTDGWQSVYAHLSRLAVAPGTPIRQGQLVGYIGSTGNSTGPHLHLALYYHGSPGENGMNYAEMAWPQYRE